MVQDNESSELARLQGQLDTEDSLRAKLADWKTRYEQASEQARLSNNAYKKLTREIEELEGRGLRSLACRLSLQHKKIIARKQAKAAVLSAQYKKALEQQKEPEEKIRFYENELLKLKGIKRRMERIEEEKLSALKEIARRKNPEFAQMEEEISSLKDNAARLRKVLKTAQSASATAKEILTFLENAEQIGELDLYGGNIFAGMEKHEQLNRAKNLFASLAEQVKGFRGELAGIRLQENPSLDTGKFLKFSDYILDNPVTDSIMLNQIKKCAQPVIQFRSQLEPVMRRLRAQLSDIETECARQEGRLLQGLYSVKTAEPGPQAVKTQPDSCTGAASKGKNPVSGTGEKNVAHASCPSAKEPFPQDFSSSSKEPFLQNLSSSSKEPFLQDFSSSSKEPFLQDFSSSSKEPLPQNLSSSSKEPFPQDFSSSAAKEHGVSDSVSAGNPLQDARFVAEAQLRPSAFVIRGYELRDVPAMIALWNETAEAGFSFPQEERLTEITGAVFFAGQSFCRIAEKRSAEESSGEIAGLYCAHPSSTGRCSHILSACFALPPQSKEPETAEALIRDCMDQARRTGFRILQTDMFSADNMDAIYLFEKAGFRRLGTLPGGFRLKTDRYEDACLYYTAL